MKKLTNNDFINKSNNIHNSKYDYSKTNYVNSWTKVEIICPIHGSFWQLPSNHTAGKSQLHSYFIVIEFIKNHQTESVKDNTLSTQEVLHEQQLKK